MTAAIYTYAFFPVPSPERLGEVEKIEGLSQSVQTVIPDGSRIAAVVEPLADPQYLESSDEILLRSALRHDQVICQLFAQFQVLPLCFGTCFVSQERLQEHLLAHQSAYEQALAALTGRAEYLLKAYRSTPSASTPSESGQPVSGTAYLLAKKQEYLRQHQAQTQREAEIEAFKHHWPPSWPQQWVEPQGNESIRLYFLLSSTEFDQAQILTQTWLTTQPHWQVEWSSALPPYHFVNRSA